MANKKSTLENEIEDYLVKQVEAHGGLCMKLRPTTGRGFPDRTIVMPGGWAAFVECKRPKGGVVAKQQSNWAKRLTERKAIFYWINTKHDVDLLIKDYTLWKNYL